MNFSQEIDLEKVALQIRLNMVRAFSANGGGHIGGSMDLAELMAVLYSDFMRVKTDMPKWENRDFMIFSKGHAGPALYAALAWRGFFLTEYLDNLNNNNSLLPGHCDRNKVLGVDATTGSLGQGLSIACGVALASKARKTNQRIFCVVGDGEAAEGQIWEAAQCAAHFKLDNLIAFLDWNKMQIDGCNDDVMALGNPVDKFSAFGWNAKLISGSDVLQIQKAVKNALEKPNHKPIMIILDTIKGQGANSIMQLENNHCIAFPVELRNEVLEELRLKAKEIGLEAAMQ